MQAHLQIGNISFRVCSSLKEKLSEILCDTSPENTQSLQIAGINVLVQLYFYIVFTNEYSL